MGAWREKCFVYSVTNPIDNSIFYVGETSYPKARFKQHMGKKSKLSSEIKKILDAGLKPIFTILEECDYGTHIKNEKKWIKIMEDAGHVLMNKKREKKEIDYNFIIVNNTLN